MSTGAGPLPRLDAFVARHHDYVWARLPFLVPMAIAAARRRGDRATRELARLIAELRPLLLGHLDREETLLVRPVAAPVTARSCVGIHAEHVAVIALLDRIRDVAGADFHAPTGADPTERVLYTELARLDEHVHAQIAVEEHLMRRRQAA